MCLYTWVSWCAAGRLRTLDRLGLLEDAFCALFFLGAFARLLEDAFWEAIFFAFCPFFCKLCGRPCLNWLDVKLMCTRPFGSGNPVSQVLGTMDVNRNNWMMLENHTFTPLPGLQLGSASLHAINRRLCWYKMMFSRHRVQVQILCVVACICSLFVPMLCSVLP